MIAVTERDVDIFRVLSSGPTTFDQLYGTMLRKQLFFKPQALRKRLHILMTAHYLASRVYHSRNGGHRYSLYALTDQSAGVLVESGYDYHWIRKALPDEYRVTHELAVTEVVRAIKREAGQIDYDVSIRDEMSLKEEKTRRKKTTYPDLLVSIRIVVNKRVTKQEIAIEVDNSTIPPYRVVEKARKLGHMTVYLCMTTQRIDALRRAFSYTGDEKLCNKLVFGLLSDFSSKVFLGTTLINVSGQTGTFFPEETTTAKRREVPKKF